MRPRSRSFATSCPPASRCFASAARSSSGSPARCSRRCAALASVHARSSSGWSKCHISMRPAPTRSRPSRAKQNIRAPRSGWSGFSSSRPDSSPSSSLASLARGGPQAGRRGSDGLRPRHEEGQKEAMSMKSWIAVATLALAGSASAEVATRPAITLSRLDCGSILIRDFNSFFSDTLEYQPGPRTIPASCYLVRHGRDLMLWDTGYPASFKGKSVDRGPTIASVKVTIAEQLAELGLKPTDISIVGISHMHADHTGQASEFPRAKLIVGKADFELTKGDKDPFGPWRGDGARGQLMHGAGSDGFGDGSVRGLNLPGHTPHPMGLL